MDLPHLPKDEAESTDHAAMSLRTKIVIAAVAVILVLIIVLHLTGVVGES